MKSLEFNHLLHGEINYEGIQYSNLIYYGVHFIQ